MAAKFIYRQLQGNEIKYYLFLCLVGLATLIGGISAYYMETNGHHVTGMNNHVVWGMPHVFAIFLILAASGAFGLPKEITTPLIIPSALLLSQLDQDPFDL